MTRSVGSPLLWGTTRAVATALLVDIHVLWSVSGARLAEERLSKGPPNVVATLDANWPRKAKRTRWWKVPMVLPLLAGASPLAGPSPFLSAGVDRGIRLLPWAPNARASLPRFGISEDPASAAPRRGLAPAQQEDGLMAADTREWQALPTLFALRGGAEILQKEHDHEIYDHPSRNGSPDDREPDKERSSIESLEESWQLLLKGAWKVTVRRQQTLRMEFVQKGDGMYVEVSYSDPPEDNFELVKVQAMVVTGRYLGFGGGTGTLYFHFSHAGDDLRVDLRYPSSFWDGRDQITMFAAPVARRVRPASVSPTADVVRLHEGLIHSIERLLLRGKDKPPREEIAASIHATMALLRKPGRWVGRAPLSGTLEMDNIEFKFIPHFDYFECMFALEWNTTSVVDIMEVRAWDVGDYGTELDRSPGYVFTAAGERLKVEITYLEGDFMRRLQTHLDFELIPGTWPVSALYAHRARDVRMQEAV